MLLQHYITYCIYTYCISGRIDIFFFFFRSGTILVNATDRHAILIVDEFSSGIASRNVGRTSVAVRLSPGRAGRSLAQSSGASRPVVSLEPREIPRISLCVTEYTEVWHNDGPPFSGRKDSTLNPTAHINSRERVSFRRYKSGAASKRVCARCSIQGAMCSARFSSRRGGSFRRIRRAFDTQAVYRRCYQNLEEKNTSR